MLAGISLCAWRRMMSGTSSLPMPWPSKSTAMVSRRQDSADQACWHQRTGYMHASELVIFDGRAEVARHSRWAGRG
jgi:hypothetical protein